MWVRTRLSTLILMVKHLSQTLLASALIFFFGCVFTYLCASPNTSRFHSIARWNLRILDSFEINHFFFLDDPSNESIASYSISTLASFTQVQSTRAIHIFSWLKLFYNDISSYSLLCSFNGSNRSSL